MSMLDDVRKTIDSAVRAASRRARFASAYKTVFDTPEGKLILSDLLTKAGVLTVIGPPADADDRAFADGARSVGLHIIGRLRWSERELVALAKEQAAEDLERRLQAEGDV